MCFIDWGMDTRASLVQAILVLPAIPFERREGMGKAASTSVTRPGAVDDINWIRFDQQTEAGKLSRFPVLLFPFRIPGPSVHVSQTGPGAYVIVDGDRTDKIFVADGPDDQRRNCLPMPRWSLLPKTHKGTIHM